MKKVFWINSIIVAIAVLFLTTECNKETTATLPILSTISINAITAAYADFDCKIVSTGEATITACGVCWSTTANPSTSDSKTSDNTEQGKFTSRIVGLTAGTTFHVRAYASNSVGTSYTEDLNFSTKAKLPNVSTSPVTVITFSTASCGGNISHNGGGTITSSGVCWSTTMKPTISDYKTIDGTSAGSFTSSISGLTNGTTYHVRAYATNSTGTAYGSDITFTTESGLPLLTTTPVSAVTYATATCGGNITSEGAGAVISRGVCWSTGANPTTDPDTKTLDGSGTGNFESSITGLTANTTYYVRAYATNIAGTSYGNQITLTTTLPLPTNGLLVYYPFNANANDESGNNYNGTVVGAALTTDRFNNQNKAYHFIGLNRINTSFSGVLGNADRSISFWVKISGQENGGSICNYGGGYGTSFAPAINPAIGVNDIAHLDISNATVSYKASKPNDDIWHHYVYIFSTSYGTSLNGVRIYQDGILLTEIVNSYHYAVYDINTSSATPFTFGAAEWENGSYSVDDFRFYDRILTTVEIQQLYHEGGW
jgi:hypothetical protein